MTKKMGRPTADPKPYRIVVRINENQNNILNQYCEENQVNKMQAIRNGIEMLDVKKK